MKYLFIGMFLLYFLNFNLNDNVFRLELILQQIQKLYETKFNVS